MNYLKHRDQIMNCDVLLYKGDSLTSKIIKWKTGSEYSHAGIVGWWGDQLMVLESTGKGVYPVRLSKNIKHYHGSVEWWRYTYPMLVGDRELMLEFAKDEIGKEYPKWWEFLKFFGGKDSDDRFKIETKIVMCAQFVARTYNYKDYDLASDLSDEFTTPEAIIQGGKIELMGVFK